MCVVVRLVPLAVAAALIATDAIADAQTSQFLRRQENASLGLARAWPWPDKKPRTPGEKYYDPSFKPKSKKEPPRPVEEPQPVQPEKPKTSTLFKPVPKQAWGADATAPVRRQAWGQAAQVVLTTTAPPAPLQKTVTAQRHSWGQQQAATNSDVPHAWGETVGNTTVLSRQDATQKIKTELKPPMARTIGDDTKKWGKNFTSMPNKWGHEDGAHLGGHKPRVFFLFLAVDKVSNLDVWKSFFATAPRSLFRAYVHCKELSCDSMVANSPLKSIPSVPSYYCTDLVSPMNKLISWALNNDDGEPHPLDKFAFVSDSTLPAKPFMTVYSTLAKRDGSDFCVFPSAEWADARTGNRLEMAPKHHQWVTLVREHAERSAKLWEQGYSHRLMDHFNMNKKAWKWSDNSYADQRNFGCLDEFWHMAALYGTMYIHPHDSSTVEMPEFMNGPLRIDYDTAWQGECDTFVIWSEYMYTGLRNPFERLHLALDHHSIPHGGNSARPGWWDKISPSGIRAIRKSDFLFVRKFVDRPQLVIGEPGETFADAFSRIVLK